MYKRYSEGYIELVWGPMYSGKTSELIRRVVAMEYAKEEVIVFKPSIDNRYSEDSICSHTGHEVKSHSIEDPKDMFNIIKQHKGQKPAVAIDEVQFFDPSVVEVISELANDGYRVMCAGLDQDFRGVPFPNTASIAAIAEFNTKLAAFCTVCGGPATKSQRFVDGEPASMSDPIVMVGAVESYEARCRHHHQI